MCDWKCSNTGSFKEPCGMIARSVIVPSVSCAGRLFHREWGQHDHLPVCRQHNTSFCRLRRTREVLKPSMLRFTAYCTSTRLGLRAVDAVYNGFYPPTELALLSTLRACVSTPPSPTLSSVSRAYTGLRCTHSTFCLLNSSTPFGCPQG